MLLHEIKQFQKMVLTRIKAIHSLGSEPWRFWECSFTWAETYQRQQCFHCFLSFAASGRDSRMLPKRQRGAMLSAPLGGNFDKYIFLCVSFGRSRPLIALIYCHREIIYSFTSQNVFSLPTVCQALFCNHQWTWQWLFIRRRITQDITDILMLMM